LGTQRLAAFVAFGGQDYSGLARERIPIAAIAPRSVRVMKAHLRCTIPKNCPNTLFVRVHIDDAPRIKNRCSEQMAELPLFDIVIIHWPVSCPVSASRMTRPLASITSSFWAGVQITRELQHLNVEYSGPERNCLSKEI